MAISRINNNSEDYYKKLSTMKKVNSAADNAAGLAIVNKLLSQSNGYDMATYNAETSGDMLKVAEGGLSGIQDSLQRMRELSVQASNGILSPDDKMAIQEEINGLKAGIQDAAKGTQFNTLKLLDGSMADMNLAINPDGTGMEIQMVNSTLESLGIADFDVTKNFSISDIDNAISKVNEARSYLGATSNVLEGVVNVNNITSENLTNARSRIEDLDVPKAVSDLQKQKILQQYQQFAMMERERNNPNNISRLMGM